jgi:hypothetical protein
VRVLFTVSAWPTHFMSMVPTGWALQAAGHEVRVLCTPSQSAALSGAGLIPVPVLRSMDIAIGNRLQYYWEAVAGVWPYPWLPLHPLTGEEMASLDDFDVAAYRRDVEPGLAEQAARSFDEAVAFARYWQPDLVLHDPVSLEGILAAKVVGVPAVVFLWGPAGTHEAEHMRIVPCDLSKSFPRFGLGDFDLDMIEYAADPCPSTVAPPTEAERLAVCYVPYNGSAPVPKWLMEEPARPRVCVVWSTALTTMSGPNSYLLPMLVDALVGRGFEIVLTATVADVRAFGQSPDSVRVMENFPLRLLLPSCDAVVHHGGGGSTMTSIWSTTPQLAVTFASEQAVNGERIAATGAGVWIPGHGVSRAAIRDAVDDLLTVESYRDSMAELNRELCARPTPADLVGDLQLLAQKAR